MADVWSSFVLAFSLLSGLHFAVLFTRVAMLRQSGFASA
jgi:hypothetical protein